MKHFLSLVLFLSPVSLCSSELIQSDRTINTQSLPKLDELKSSLVYSFVQQALFEASEKNLTQEKEILEHLNQLHLHKNILSLEPEKMYELIRLTAFLIHLTFEEFSIRFNPEASSSSELSLSWCSCLSTAKRITWALETLLVVAQKDVLSYTKEKPFVYSSIGSGTLLQDYLITAGLIKLGISTLTINLIDPIYSALSTSIESVRQDYDIHLATIKNLIQQDLQPNAHDYEILKKLQLKLRPHFRAERMKTQLKQLFHSLYTDPAPEWPIDAFVFWEKYKDYQRRILHYKERKKVDVVESLLSDLVVLVDPGQEEPVRALVIDEFKKLCKTGTKADSVASSLIDADVTISWPGHTFTFTLPESEIP